MAGRAHQTRFGEAQLTWETNHPAPISTFTKNAPKGVWNSSKRWWPMSKHPLHTFKFTVTPSWDEHGQHRFPYFQDVFHAACEGGHVDVVEHLLALGFWVYKQDSLGRTPLKTACEQGQAACAALCLDARGQRRTRRQWTNTIPCGLCRRKHCDCRFPLSEGG